jgi:DNA primase catalytic core
MTDTKRAAGGRHFPEHFLEEIKARIPLSQLIAPSVEWDRAKSTPRRGVFWTCCPFHGEKTASFRVDDDRGHYHCFGCSEHGDHFAWTMKREGNTFPEAVATIAQMAGLPLPQLTPQQEEAARKRSTAFEVNEAATNFFERQLAGKHGAQARAYLKERGVTAEQVKTLRLGYAPQGQDECCRHLATAGFNSQDLLDAGVAREGKGTAKLLDRFHGRIMFPIRDRQGRVAGFAGRAIVDDVEPKYLNSPEGPAFSKGSILWNLDRANDAARDRNDLIICEGYLDVLAIERAGIPQTVAPMGTAITEEQLALAWRVAEEPCICLDGDEAGRKAARRLLSLALPLLRPGRSLSFVSLPEGLDPDEMVRKEGADALAAALAKRQPFSDLQWHALSEDVDLSTPERQAAFSKAIAATVARIVDAEVRAAYEASFTVRHKRLLKEQGISAAGSPFVKRARNADRGAEANEKDNGKGGRAPRQTDNLVSLVEAAGTELFVDPEDDAYATMKVDQHFETWPIKSNKFRRWLTGLYYRATEGGVGGQAMQDALTLLEAKANMSGKKFQTFRRIGHADGHIYVDLCDDQWRAIEVRADGWSIIDRAPCRFLRTPAMRALCEPEAGGMIEELGRFLNFREEVDFQLIIGWLIGAFRPTGPYAILIFTDEQGSGKSHICRVLQWLVDPNGSPLRSMPDNERDLFINAYNRRVVTFDNVSAIPEHLSDTLCRISTGGGVAYRELYSNKDESYIELARPIILNGISDFAQRPDLASRSLRVSLKAISECERRTESDLWAELEQARPRMLGAILDGVACALKNLDSVKLTRLPRMADFVQWVTAAEPALGWEREAFLKAFESSAAELNELIADDDILVSSLINFFVSRGGAAFYGTAANLLNVLNETVEERVRKSIRWPSSPTKLGNKLRRMVPILKAQGYQVEFSRGAKRTIHIEPPATAPNQQF